MEKTIDLRQAKAWCSQYPDDQLGKLRLEKAEREVNDIAGWMKERSKEREGPEIER